MLLGPPGLSIANGDVAQGECGVSAHKRVFGAPTGGHGYVMFLPAVIAEAALWLLTRLGGLQDCDVGCRVAHVGEGVAAAHRGLGGTEGLV